MPQRLAYALLLAIQGLGLAFSLALIVITFQQRENLQAAVQSFAIDKIETATVEYLEDNAVSLSSSPLGQRLEALADRLSTDAAALDQQRSQIVTALLQHSLSDRCEPHCAFSLLLSGATYMAMAEKIAETRVGETTVRDFIVQRYETTVSGLITDLRRFGIVNATVFALMIGLVLFRGHLNWRFAAFSVVLTGYAGWAIHGYLFRQDWVRSVLFNDWAAPGYQAAMIVVSLVLADWLFLRGFVTQAIVHAVTSIVST